VAFVWFDTIVCVRVLIKFIKILNWQVEYICNLLITTANILLRHLGFITALVSDRESIKSSGQIHCTVEIQKWKKAHNFLCRCCDRRFTVGPWLGKPFLIGV
jgi:hypothetical protein